MRNREILLEMVLKDEPDAIKLEVVTWDITESGALFIVESDNRRRAVAPGIWLEVVGTRKAGASDDN